MAATFDVIVVGVGGMGSAACYELARRGLRVLGLEQFELVHSRGSSHGQTRIIRTAYAEGPEYVPLVQRAFEKWYDLEQFTGRHLLTECACLNVGPPDSEHVRGVRRSVQQHRLTAEELSGSAINRRFPAFRFPADWQGVLEQAAGFLFVEECVRAQIHAAVAWGAEIHAHEPVQRWHVLGSGVEVTTERGTYQAAQLVVTAGAWATRLLADLGVPLRVMRQVLLWFDVRSQAAQFRRDRFPIFLADVADGPYYGLPAIDRCGIKVARHYNAPEWDSPDQVDWTTTADDERPIRQFLDRFLPGVGPQTQAQVCMYTLTPDRHFVIDQHPAYPPVWVACGFSGHGFKFAPMVGEILAEGVAQGRFSSDMRFFSVRRFA
ncbi:MAG: N-methyl-L-tryptophan oxidase [Gemmataceae bacterium]|nr:N-methyl-L-tryptophan oxidase [Gemmata sp.]MDW8198913.1 N-methyl-L-tryptophan oxidase [Gemmataceae bacterium]